MTSIEIDFGHAASHSPWLVHEPKYSSIVSTIASVRAKPLGLALRQQVEVGDLGRR